MANKSVIQRQCPECKAWIDSDDRTCPECDYSFDPIVREQKRKEALHASGQKFKIWIDNVRSSEHWAAQVIYSLLRVVWFVYMAILTIIIYFVALFSG